MPTINDTDLEWSDAFSTDIVSIDRQHQELMQQSQNLLRVLSSDTASLSEKQAVYQDLVDQTLTHFDDEERIMRNICYPEISSHLREHGELRAEIDRITKDVMDGKGLEDWQGLVSLIQVWLLRHIANSDTKIRDHLQRRDNG